LWLSWWQQQQQQKQQQQQRQGGEETVTTVKAAAAELSLLLSIVLSCHTAREAVQSQKWAVFKESHRRISVQQQPLKLLQSASNLTSSKMELKAA
jgi:hypothetical protein